jgi:hypothetical protein
MTGVADKLENARRQLEDIRTKRTQAQETLRQLDLNEAAWLGFIEALSPYENDEEQVETQDVPE